MTTTMTSRFGVAFLTAALFLTVAAPAFAETGTPKTQKTVKNLSCVQTAVDVRETAVATAFDEHFTDLKSALSARKSALNTAWGLTDKNARKDAIKKAWSDFKTAKVASQKDLTSARKSAWSTFRSTVKTTCKEVVPVTDTEKSDTIS